MAETSPNPNWVRWVFASFSDHFTTAFADKLPLYIEGQHRDTRELKDFLELRIDGPFAIQVSRGCWKLRSEVSILIQSVMDDKDYHRHVENLGIAQSAFDVCIPMFRYGCRDADDDTFLGQMKLLQNRANRDFLEVYNFGQIDKDRKLMQGTVEAHYQMELTT
jgi:hypothetical protein